MADKDELAKVSEKMKAVIQRIGKSKETQDILKEIFALGKEADAAICDAYSVDMKSKSITANNPAMQNFLDIIEENRSELITEMFELAYKGDIDPLAYSNILAGKIKDKSANADAILQHLENKAVTSAANCSCIGCVACTGCVGCCGCLACLACILTGTISAFSAFSISSAASSASSASISSAA